MEQLTLTTPTPAYRVAKLYLDWDGAVIRIWLRGTDGLEERWHVYDGDTATALMVALNTANLSVTSLHRRILDRLVADGVLVGTVTGTPD